MLGLIKAAVDRAIVQHLPQRQLNYNGVVVPRGRLLEVDGDRPDYGAPSVEMLRELVSSGDDVVVVGAGYGVSSVVAARHAGADGFVLGYEAHSGNVRRARETVRRNSMSDRVTIRHATVGVPGGNSAFGEADGDVVDAVELPGADVALVDCEGAEDVIVPRWVSGPPAPPETLLVEVHEQFGARGDMIVDALEGAGYVVTERESVPKGPDGNYVLRGER